MGLFTIFCVNYSYNQIILVHRLTNVDKYLTVAPNIL